MALFNLFKKKQKEEETPEVQASRQQEVNEGFKKTKEGLFGKLARAVAGKSQVDDEVLDNLEEVLITSDVGVETTVKIIRNIEERVARDKYMNASELRSILRDEVSALLQESDSGSEDFGLELREGVPYVVMVVGVNGVGKPPRSASWPPSSCGPAARSISVRPIRSVPRPSTSCRCGPTAPARR